ncbi:MAG: hypothetical protein ABIH41_02975 [Nanoarchaeota archaeon]
MMKRRDVIVLLVLVAVLAYGLTSMFYLWLGPAGQHRILGGETVNVTLSITPYRQMNFNANTDGLHFDGVPQGSSARKYITLTNIRTVPVNVEVAITGNITAFMIAYPSSFSLDPGTSANITVSVDVPSEAEAASYDGSLIIVYRHT